MNVKSAIAIFAVTALASGCMCQGDDCGNKIAESDLQRIEEAANRAEAAANRAEAAAERAGTASEKGEAVFHKQMRK